jgi:hypothetical protein
VVGRVSLGVAAAVVGANHAEFVADP